MMKLGVVLLCCALGVVLQKASALRPRSVRSNSVAAGILVGLGLGGWSPSALELPSASAPVVQVRAAEGGGGVETLDGEALRIFMKAQSAISDGDFPTAQGFLEQVVEVEPNAIYAWSNLGNVLVSRGNLDQALLCYKKAITLHPRRDQLGIIILNRASVEMSLGKNDEALRDLNAAERLSGPTAEIVTTKAVALTNSGKWDAAVVLFEEIIKTSDRDALPWWLRYSESLLETGRGTEAVAFLQRTLNRYPYEDDVKGFAVALYTSLGSKTEAQRYWRTMDSEARKQYSDASFYTTKLLWGPKTIAGFEAFLKSSYANVDPNAGRTAIRQGAEISDT